MTRQETEIKKTIEKLVNDMALEAENLSYYYKESETFHVANLYIYIVLELKEENGDYMVALIDGNGDYGDFDYCSNNEELYEYLTGIISTYGVLEQAA